MSDAAIELTALLADQRNVGAERHQQNRGECRRMSRVQGPAERAACRNYLIVFSARVAG
jgi:hypothetical protein